ncbi:hypothetical protein ACFDR9_005426, partial [Janthinobacterium sp. CG_23.3]
MLLKIGPLAGRTAGLTPTKMRTKKSPVSLLGFFNITSLTITYFHTGCSTIIGA